MNRAVAALVLIAACAGPPPVQPPPQPALLAALSPAEFRAADRVLDGIDAAGDRGWQTGDRVLLGLRLQKESGTERWLMLLTLQSGKGLRGVAHLEGQPPTTVELPTEVVWHYQATHDGKSFDLAVKSRLLPVKVAVFAADSGQELGGSLIMLPADLLGDGVMAAAAQQSAMAAEVARGVEPPRLADVAAVERVMAPSARAVMAMMSVLRVVQEDSVLAPYFWQVVEKPGLLSVIANFGVKVDGWFQLDRAVPAASGPAHLQSWLPGMVVPVRVDVNGAPALFTDVLAVAPTRPLALCGGMIAAEARHPSRPEVQFAVVLLAARLGQPAGATAGQ